MTASSAIRVLEVKWISVEDHLPPCAATVLAYVPATQMRLRAFYLPEHCVLTEVSPAGWYEDTQDGYQPQIQAEVTHWMELPGRP